MKFLHIADVHLGCTRYNLSESAEDFFRSWVDVLERYAIRPAVDFVLIAGDFFHKRNLTPEAMNHAFVGLDKLRSCHIPVVAIEGNHDQRPTDQKESWLRTLSKWQLLNLLETESREGKVTHRPFDNESRLGGYIDINRARIFGCSWYGAMLDRALTSIADSIKQNSRQDAFQILLLHTDVEGYQRHPSPGLSLAKLQSLKGLVHYIGLGHTHVNYSIDNWAFNPGSLEVTSISEYHETRGVYLVTVNDDNSFTAEHLTDYYFRPFSRLRFTIEADETPDEVKSRYKEFIQENRERLIRLSPPPIVEITLAGKLGFAASALAIADLRQIALDAFEALAVRIKNLTTPAETEILPQEASAAPYELELEVAKKLIARDRRFSSDPDIFAKAAIAAKQMALSSEPPENIAGLIGAALDEYSTKAPVN
ncbi:MAG TPA: DNA repair exonuclease [Pyrinomonadaceae bacterium]|nr:DNA repair exonuclease [Pyrinomonadaceae bacterium]